jgi:hypothetical protein
VTALDKAARYRTSAYYGNPDSGLNTNEPYVFVDFVAKGATFNKIVFDNTNSIGTGFESDNHTITATSATMSNDHVFVEDLSADTPEPAVWIDRKSVV